MIWRSRPTSGSRPPRVAPLLLDLNVEAGGSINASARADRLVVTWAGVPEFGTTSANTFQVTLFSDGRITFACGALNSRFAVVSRDGIRLALSRGDFNRDVILIREQHISYREVQSDATRARIPPPRRRVRGGGAERR